MQIVDLLGTSAGCLTTLAFLPQVLHTWRHRSAGDLSLIWLATFTTGVVLWAVYGWVLGSWPIVVTNLVTFVLVASLTGFKLREILAQRRVDLRATDAPHPAGGGVRDAASSPAAPAFAPVLPIAEGEPSI
jgi:MtN3 and saliva related transmembrane protein